jgi:hypothetical protein
MSILSKSSSLKVKLHWYTNVHNSTQVNFTFGYCKFKPDRYISNTYVIYYCLSAREQLILLDLIVIDYYYKVTINQKSTIISKSKMSLTRHPCIWLTYNSEWDSVFVLRGRTKTYRYRYKTYSICYFSSAKGYMSLPHLMVLWYCQMETRKPIKPLWGWWSIPTRPSVSTLSSSLEVTLN